MLDLNNAGEQKEGSGPIPPKSIVPVRMTLRPAKPGKNPGSQPLLTRAESGMEYLDCEFEILAGQFVGRKMWDNFNLFGARDEGQKKSVDITLRLLRAIVEAVRNINPKDHSPAAVQARNLNSLEELQGTIFGVKVGIKKIKAGDRYVNNSISRIITPEHEFYSQVMNGQDLITSEPVPEITQASAAPAPGWASPGSAARPAAPAAQGWAPPAPASRPAPAQTTPAWAQQPLAGQRQGQDLGPAFPSEASGMDQVPF
jgi:hypothetical protein